MTTQTVDLDNAEAIFSLIDTRELVVVVAEECSSCYEPATHIAGPFPVCPAHNENAVPIEAFVDAVAGALGVQHPGDIVWSTTDAIGLPA